MGMGLLVLVVDWLTFWDSALGAVLGEELVVAGGAAVVWFVDERRVPDDQNRKENDDLRSAINVRKQCKEKIGWIAVCFPFSWG